MVQLQATGPRHGYLWHPHSFPHKKWNYQPLVVFKNSAPSVLDNLGLIWSFWKHHKNCVKPSLWNHETISCWIINLLLCFSHSSTSGHRHSDVVSFPQAMRRGGDCENIDFNQDRQSEIRTVLSFRSQFSVSVCQAYKPSVYSTLKRIRICCKK